MRNRSTLFAVVLCTLTAHLAQAQAGQMDTTFNPSDLGFGNGGGANGTVITSVI